MKERYLLASLLMVLSINSVIASPKAEGFRPRQPAQEKKSMQSKGNQMGEVGAATPNPGDPNLN